MYLIACSVIFLIASSFKQIRHECLIVSAVFMATGLIHLNIPTDNDMRYWTRAAILTLGAMALCHKRSLFGFYQASIYAMSLAVYAALAFDVSQYNMWVAYGSIGDMPSVLVWGERYRSLTNGLVICQFAGFLPIIWSAIRPIISVYYNFAANLLRRKGGIK